MSLHLCQVIVSSSDRCFTQPVWDYEKDICSQNYRISLLSAGVSQTLVVIY